MWDMNPLPSAVLKMIAVITTCPSSAMRACRASYNFRTNRSLLGSCHVTTLSSPHRTPKPFRTTPQIYFLHRRSLCDGCYFFTCVALTTSSYWNWLVCSRPAPQLSADSSSHWRWRTGQARATRSNQSPSRHCYAPASR